MAVVSIGDGLPSSVDNRRSRDPGFLTTPRSPALWKDIPTWFLIAEDDRMIVPETQRYMAERMKAKTTAQAVDHAPSVTAPATVVDIIRDAMRSVTGD